MANYLAIGVELGMYFNRSLKVTGSLNVSFSSVKGSYRPTGRRGMRRR